MSEKFKGFSYPITKKPRGLFQRSSNTNQIKADLLQLLLTNPGERVMLLDFGIPLKDLMFEPNDEILVAKARQMIINAIRIWEPRIILQAIDVGTIDEDYLNNDDNGEETDHILFIKLRFYDPENISEIQELRLNVPIGG